MFSSFSAIINSVKKSDIKKRLAIVNAVDDASIDSAILAAEEKIVKPLLFGNESIITEKLNQKDVKNFNNLEIIDCKTDKEAAVKAVEFINNGKADILMKGFISTSTFLKAVLDPEKGLRDDKKALLSDVFVFYDKFQDKLVSMSDGGVNLYPTIDEKIEIIKNSVKVAHKLGNNMPKTALLAAVEVVNPKMPLTGEAAVISQMNARGQIKGCIIDGPLALDNAISKKAAEIKKIDSPVAGNADILIVPSIEAGNIFGKSLTLYADFEVGHVIMGAKAPIVITSRSDEKNVKINSMALASIIS